MTAHDLLLGLDIGTTTTKAVLVDEDGRELSAARVATPFADHDGRIEMGVDDLRAAVGGALKSLGAARQRARGVGIAGLAESGAALDDSGGVLSPIIAWHDSRGEETVARLKERFGDGLARRIGRRVRTVSSVAKLGWLIENGCRGVARWLGVPELCLWQLTGSQATEHSLVSRTGWYDVGRRAYMPEVAEAVGATPEVFAPIEPAGAVFGEVTASASGWSGLPEGVPVTLAGHDHLAGAEGAGARYGDLVNSVGTAETMVRQHAEVPDLPTALELNTAVSVRPGGNGWVVFASAARAGVILARVTEALGLQADELDELADAGGSVDAVEILRAAEGSRPLELPDAPPGAIWNGLLQVLAERGAEAGERLARLLGAEQRVLVFGGGSRSGPWVRAKARVALTPLLRFEGEAVGRGAAVFAGVAAGWWHSAGAAPLPSLERVGGQRAGK